MLPARILAVGPREDKKVSGEPGFNESYYGFRSFNTLLEEAQTRNMLKLERDEKSGGYIIRVLAHED